MLHGSYRVVLARHEGRLIGFVTAISDGVLAAFMPLLEELPEYQHRGVGSELTRRMIESLRGMYMIDLVCDQGLASFYERQGMVALAGMAIRNRDALAPTTAN